MSFISSILQPFKWLFKVFVDHIQNSAHVAIVITESIKSLLNNPVTGFLENIADTITGTQIPTNLANLIAAQIPKILAVELSIQGLPANPTEADILAFEQDVLKAFNVTSNNSKLYTELAAQTYGIIQGSVASGKTKFSDWVADITQIYADYKLDLASNTAQVVPQ